MLYLQLLVLLFCGFLVDAGPIEGQPKRFRLENVEADYQTMVKEFAKTRIEGSFVTPHFDWEYVMHELTIGTPKKKIKVSAETGVTDFLVFHSRFRGPKEEGGTMYDECDSTTATPMNQSFASSTGGIRLTGHKFNDKVEFDYRLPTWMQTFGAVQQMDRFDGGFSFDGVLGIGWDPHNIGKAGNTNSSMLINLLNSGGVYDLKWMFEVGKKYSRFTFFVDQPVKEWLPVHATNGVASLTLTAFAFNNYHDNIARNAIVDSGYAVIAMPRSSFRPVIKQLDPTFDSETGLMWVSCKSRVERPLVELHLDIRRLVYPSYYVLDRKGPNGLCVLAMAQSVDENYYLGLPFIRTVALIYDTGKNKMGFGPAPDF